MSAFLICLTLFMPCLTISAFRSEWKHIPCYEKMSPCKSQLVKLISILSQILGWWIWNFNLKVQATNICVLSGISMWTLLLILCCACAYLYAWQVVPLPSAQKGTHWSSWQQVEQRWGTLLCQVTAGPSPTMRPCWPSLSRGTFHSRVGLFQMQFMSKSWPWGKTNQDFMYFSDS